MKEIKVVKYSKQWCKTRMAIYTIICIISYYLYYFFLCFCFNNANYGTFL